MRELWLLIKIFEPILWENVYVLENIISSILSKFGVYWTARSKVIEMVHFDLSWLMTHIDVTFFWKEEMKNLPKFNNMFFHVIVWMYQIQDGEVWKSLQNSPESYDALKTRLQISIVFDEQVCSPRNIPLRWFCNHTIVLKI